jgi:hypothetical protein
VDVEEIFLDEFIEKRLIRDSEATLGFKEAYVLRR